MTVDPPDAWIGIAATGVTYGEVREALRRLGLSNDEEIAAAGIRLLQLRLPLPFDVDVARSFARGLDEIVVVEEKDPTLELLMKDALYGTPDAPRVLGKRDDHGNQLLVGYGVLVADLITPALRSRLEGRVGDAAHPRAAAPARAHVDPAERRAIAVLLLRMPAQLGVQGPRRRARRRRHRLPHDDAADGRRTRSAPRQD